MLKPNYAWAQQVPKDDKRLLTEYATVPSPLGNGSIKGYLARPANTAAKYPVVIVVHENRGLTPYIEDVARRLGTENFMAFAPDGLTSVGGYPGDDEKGAALFGKVEVPKMTEDFVASARWLKARPESTGRMGAVGFCFGGGITNTLAVRLGPDLAAAVPFYGAVPPEADIAKIKSASPGSPWRARYPSGRDMARVRRRADGSQSSTRGLHLSEGQPRLPQRHDATL